MAGMLGIRGLSQSTGLNTLIAAYGNGFVNVGNGLGYGIPINETNNVEFDVFLESLFFQNFSNTPLTFNGTVWSRQHVSKVPIAKYIKKWNSRMHLGYIKIGSVDYPSRVWYSDLPVNNTIQWGFESGTNLKTTAGSPLVGSANAGFKAFNIKRGDPFFIISGADIGEYRVEEVIQDQQLLLTVPLKATATGVSYWAGGNWFDVSRDDGDFITWIDENNSLFTIYKRDSLHRYNGQTQTQIKDAVGTTSGRSVINIHELSLYFHGAQGLQTGFYAYDGRDSIKISGSIDKYIAGISSNMYGSIVGLREGELYRAYVGDIVNTNYNINIPKAVLTWDYNTKSWSIDPIADSILAATQFRQSSVKQTYFGTDLAKIILTPSGTDFDGSPIPWQFTPKTLYPSGTEFNNTFVRVEILSENAGGISVLYKLHLNPYNTDQEFKGLGQLDREKTIIDIPERHNQASGFQLKFQGISTQEPTPLIKKITIYYRKDATNIR